MGKIKQLQMKSSFAIIFSAASVQSLCDFDTCSVSECKSWAKYQTKHGAKFWSFDGCGCRCFAKSGSGTIDTGCGSSQWGEIGHVRGFEGQMIHGDDIYCQT